MNMKTNIINQLILEAKNDQLNQEQANKIIKGVKNEHKIVSIK